MFLFASSKVAGSFLIPLFALLQLLVILTFVFLVSKMGLLCFSSL